MGLQGPALRLGGGQCRGRLHANTRESPANAKRKTGKDKLRPMQEAFAARRRHVSRVYPKAENERVVIILDNAPWHQVKPTDEALAANPHPEFKRLPIQTQLDVIEHFGGLPRRRAIHNRLFASLAALKRSLRASPCYDRTARGKIRSLIAKCSTPPREPAKSSGT